MIKADTKHLCTGHYMNYYSRNGEFDLFIIINEGNGDATEPIGIHDLEDADVLCSSFCENKEMNSDECKELELLLEDIFGYGVQVFRK